MHESVRFIGENPDFIGYSVFHSNLINPGFMSFNPVVEECYNHGISNVVANLQADKISDYYAGEYTQKRVFGDAFDKIWYDNLPLITGKE